jgi:type II secretory pathway component GspD/PulD (secretin)
MRYLYAISLAIAFATLNVGTGKPTNPPAPTPSVEIKAQTSEPEKKEESVQIDVGTDGISLFATDADAHELFIKLAKASGLKIIIDDTVKRTVTANLVNRKATDIIKNIASAYGLAAKQVDGIFLISDGIPKTPSSYLLSDIEAVQTQYVLAPTAKSLLPIFLQDHVKTSQEQNAVILSAPEDVLKKFREDIKQFDIPATQIMIEVLMVEFSDSSASEFAASLEWSNDGRQFTSNSPYGDIVFQTLSTLPTVFSTKLKAFVSKGKARVRANPRIATMSGQYASIFIGKQRYLSNPVVIGSSSSDSYSTTSNSIDAGVKLSMTPWTGGKGEIIVDIQPEISVLSAPDATTGLPDKSTRQANTTVLVNDGHTIVIGGLNQTEKMRNETRIPLLGDLPLIGHLFRSHSNTEAHTEMVIFITPHILSQTGHLSKEEEESLRKRFLEDNAPKKPSK